MWVPHKNKKKKQNKTSKAKEAVDGQRKMGEVFFF